uniref:CCC domain-containing protein n=1 Tax=Anopheles maculatus TaxID=74869 RepID=A0A182T805_9DIPT
MARFQLLRLLVVFLGGVVSSSVLAALATSDINLPVEQDTHRHHTHQKEAAHTHQKSSDVPIYHKEHELTETSARQYVAGMSEADFRVPSWCKPCNATTLRYCRSQLFLNDHCCCEYSHANGKCPEANR